MSAGRADDWRVSSPLDRAMSRRSDAAWLAARWRSPAARLATVGPDGKLAIDARGRARLEPTSGEYEPERDIFLEGASAPISGVPPAIDDAGSGALRDIAFAAVAVVTWHRLEPRCPRCGAPTRVIGGGFERRCVRCGAERFPRTDPAVIVAIRDPRDRILLGHRADWPDGRFSVFAGFVEAGESAEQAVHREMSEEVGVRLSSLEFFGTQPWPRPRSLMLAFTARTESSRFQIDGDEIDSAEWYTRAELARALGDGSIALPPATSIARRLIDDWATAAPRE